MEKVTFSTTKISSTVYGRGHQSLITETVEIAIFADFHMPLASVKNHMFNNRIGDWKNIYKLNSSKQIKQAILDNIDDLLADFAKRSSK